MMEEEDVVRVVVVGGGCAGVGVAVGLMDHHRATSKAGAARVGLLVTLVQDPAEQFCTKPQVLSCLKNPSPSFGFLPSGYLGKKDVLHVCGVARAVDALARTVTVAVPDGRDRDLEVRYDVLVLATGAAPRVPVGFVGSRVIALRNPADSLAVRDAVVEGKRIALVGGGTLVLDVIHSLRQGGLLDRARLVIICRGTAVGASVLGPDLAASVVAPVLAQYDNVRVLANAHVLAADTRAADGTTRLRISTGQDQNEDVAVDVCVLAAGVQADLAVAASAGVDVRDGVVVDSCFATSDERIFAVGDCAETPAGLWQTWDSARTGASALAAHLHNAVVHPDAPPVRAKLARPAVFAQTVPFCGATLHYVGRYRCPPGTAAIHAPPGVATFAVDEATGAVAGAVTTSADLAARVAAALAGAGPASVDALVRPPCN